MNLKNTLLIVALSAGIATTGAHALDLGGIQPASVGSAAVDPDVTDEDVAMPACDVTDDPRLDDLGSFIEAVEAGEKPEKLTISAATYADMNPRVIAALRDRFVVAQTDCTKIISVGSVLSSKVQIPFAALSTRIASSISDDAMTKYWTVNFRPSPISTSEALSLARDVGWDQKIKIKMANMLNLKLVGHPSYLQKDGALLMLDMYLALGGRVLNPTTVVKRKSSANDIVFESGGVSVTLRLFSDSRYAEDAIPASLALAGIAIIDETGARK